MIVCRITSTAHAKALTASGRPARWNPEGKKMIYTAASISLACLENVVHRSGEGLSSSFNILFIEIPDEVAVKEILLSSLPANWKDFENYRHTQDLGNRWLNSLESALLKVPSAIVQQENNYLINPVHPYFKKIRIIKSELFKFDTRIKK